MSHTRYQQLELDLAALERTFKSNSLTQKQYNSMKSAVLEPFLGMGVFNDEDASDQQLHPVVAHYVNTLTSAFLQAISEPTRPAQAFTTVDPAVENVLQEGGYRLGQITKTAIEEGTPQSGENAFLLKVLMGHVAEEVQAAAKNVMAKADAVTGQHYPAGTQGVNIRLVDPETKGNR